MRWDDDSRDVVVFFLPGRALVSSVAFRVSRKRTFHAAFVVTCPSPRIILARFNHPRIPRVPQNVLKLLDKIRLRSDVTIKPFLFPYAASFAFRFIIACAE